MDQESLSHDSAMISTNRRMRTRMSGGVGAGGEKPPATRFLETNHRSNSIERKNMEVALKIMNTLEKLGLNHFSLEETPSGQTNLVLNEGLLITSIAENDSYQDVIERIISECVTVREIMEESADKLEDHLVLGSEETK